MDGKYQMGIVSSLISTVGSLIEDRLLKKEERIQHREQCYERLSAENSSQDEDVMYSDQAVLANLDWGMDALEEAINESNDETKMARLEYAEKMLQVCAMLNTSHKTAGIPNSYLSAWAHFNLSCLCMMRNEAHTAVLHVLEMFVVDPFFSRIDFAPEVWKSVFLPHMSSISGWYAEERRGVLMDVIPDTSDLSFTMDLDESLVLSVRPDKAERIQHLEHLYAQSLDENTRLYAKYYKDCINYDSTTSRKVFPMLPIAEPPMTPLHEFSTSNIPDYIKFGPILPKTAGFSPLHKESTRDASSMKEFARCNVVEEIPEECEECGDDQDHISVVSNRSIRQNKDLETTSKSRITSQRQSPHNSSPTDSPTTPGSRNSSPKEGRSSGKIQASMLRLLSARAMDSPHSNSSPLASHDNSSISSTDSDGQMTGQLKTARRSVHHGRSGREVLPKSSLKQGDDGSLCYTSSPISEASTPKSRPPKDFVCPITGQIFNDPVTLETGQTYERKAIQEWMSRGNTTCPITRQPLSAASLPKTNYVLKRLIASWKDQHPDLAQEFSCNETPPNYLTNARMDDVPSVQSTQIRRTIDEEDDKPQRFTRAALSTSPNSVISQASVETVINALKPCILCLSNSEDLQECEASVLEVAKIWADSNVGSGIHSYLSSPTIINGFMEILSASLNKDVLRTTLHILSQLIYADDHVSHLLTTLESDFFCLADLLKKGLSEAALVIYLLRPSFSHLSSHDLIPSLLHVIGDHHPEFQHAMAPKDTAIALLEQIVAGGDERERSHNVMTVMKENGIPALLSCLDRVDGRRSIVSILLCCIRVDITCKNTIASRIELSPILELFHGGNDCVRGICIEFLCELVQLSRRTLSNQILQIIKEEGTSSTMHTFMVYLQMSPMEQKPAIAALLLQLDLLAAPRKMSIYREEAIEALLEALQRKDFPSSQVMALSTLLSLSGHSTNSTKTFVECRLLKIAGYEQPYNTLIMGEEMSTNETDLVDMKEEETANRNWEKRMAFVLSNHEKGIIFKALEECLKSNSIEIAKSSLVVATWLVHMLYSFPDCGVRFVARKSLLDKYVNVLQSSKNIEEKILATLALRGFVSDPGGLSEISMYAKGIWKTLRRLKKSCKAVHDIMKAFMNLPSMDAAELWSCVEGPEVDVSINGEILSMVHVRNRLISSHSDGTVKVWDTGKRAPKVIQEAREHSKAVTCLCVSPSFDKLYTGSLDKTIRVWSIKQEEIRCIQVHDVKEAVLALAANTNVACFASQANGVKVYNWSGVPKNINFNKQVKCLGLNGNKLYCGCSGYSIQEVDLRTNTVLTFYSGAKKLLGKQTIYSLRIQDGLLYACGTSIDGVAGKVFKVSSKAVVGSFNTGLDIQHIAINNEMIFTATRCGIIKVWLKERVTKIAYIKINGSRKITWIASDTDGLKLFAGTLDGKLQIWNLE